ncbi:uncharacterized protein DEA37_0003868 [Paragonimus westermani]|uniref:PAS domain-containing protein n=1 Tax=Paragonimus westermani TaxID=34504 RepID=A0A5J4P3M1_9TREM|nr:uncharacterized protein DEA37_0003868 [Paragonimus westermani]
MHSGRSYVSINSIFSNNPFYCPRLSTDSAFVLGNAQSQQFPIVYCSDGFLLLTRYPRASVMSRSSACHFLWGPNTRSKDRIDVLQAFRKQTQLNRQMTLYRRTG